MIRLKDIAQKAGVSVMTVSKVMRNSSDISAATKHRVRLLAEQMGYLPNTQAQSLRTRKTRLLGVVLPALTNPEVPRLMMAIEERAFAGGYDLLLAQTLNDPEREQACIHRFISRRVDGMLIAPVYRIEPAAAIFDELIQRRVPTVILGHPAPFCQGLVSIATDDLSASQAVTRHLIQLGHRRIAFFAGPRVAPWAQERLEGYRRALREAGLEADDHLIFHAGSTIEEGARAALQLLAEAPQVTAVQVVNDMVAIGATRAWLGRGLKLPQDLSVAGFGNYLVSEFNLIPLTTTRQPKSRLGAAAMSALELCFQGQSPASQRIPAELIVRASTASPPSKPVPAPAPAAAPTPGG